MKTTVISFVIAMLCCSIIVIGQETPLPPSRVIAIGGENDVIIDTLGNSVECQVEEITIDAIKYRTADNLQGPLYIIPKASVYKIVFKNGKEEIFTKKAALDYVHTPTIQPHNTTTNTLTNTSNKCLAGQSDAELYHNRIGGNFFLGFAIGVFGVGFVALGDVKSPSLVYVSAEKASDPVYMNCYNKKAKQKNIRSAIMGALASGVISVIIFSGN